MPEETNKQTQQTLDKVAAQGKKLEVASPGTDGVITLKHSVATLTTVDVADVDLLLGFSDGTFIVIPNGALDAAAGSVELVKFTDGSDTLAALLKKVGHSNPAKAGSLRLVTENIDANKPPQEYTPDQETHDTAEIEVPAPPAPIAKVSAGAALGTKGLGKGPGMGGSGAGEGDGQVQDTVQAQTPPEPPVYKVGQKSLEQLQGRYDFAPGGEPNYSVKLFTSSAYKVAPSGRDELPSGAYDPSLKGSPDALDTLAGPANQARVEWINGTSGNDVIDHNSSFSGSTGVWAKMLHMALNNYASVTSIEITVTASAVQAISGFNLAGIGITQRDGYINVWDVDLTQHADYKENGIDLNLLYNIISDAARHAATPIDFVMQVNVQGITELENGVNIPSDITTTYSMTWRDAVTEADFNVTDANDQQMMVLPMAGIGVEVYAGDGDDVVHAGAGDDLLHGQAGNDTLYGDAGDDTLDGGLGSDTLYGGGGSDTATYKNADGSVTADLTNQANNTGEASGDYYSSIENLEGSAYNDILVGDSSANRLSGLGGNDTLEGRGEADTLDGGAGSDTASYSHDAVGVNVSLLTNKGLYGDAAGDVLVSIENLTGGSANDTLIGNDDDNILSGGVGDDILTGGKGHDQLIGGDGTADTADYSTASERVVVSFTALAGVTQYGDAAGDSYDGIENIAGSRYHDLLIGNGSSNTLNGGEGNDTLEGMGGAADSLVGGEGTDTASYAHAGVGGVVASLSTSFDHGRILSPDPASDSYGDRYDSIENLIGSDYGDTLIGDSGNNSISGGGGDDTLEGMAGADSLEGGAGINTASYNHWKGSFGVGVVASLYNPTTNTGDAAGDSYSNITNLEGSEFGDLLTGDTNTIIGNALDGGKGNDTLEGLAGADTLKGGDGSDTASYAQSQGSITASLMDAVHDNSGTDAVGDRYESIENLTGTDYGNDVLYGDDTSNILTGGAGNDTLEGMKGGDQLIGGIGDHDVASYSRAGLASSGTYTTAPGLGVVASLTSTFTSGHTLPATDNDAKSDSYSGIEDITGSTFNDLLIGNSSSNILRGGDGDDTLEGFGSAADYLYGDAGVNTASYDHSGPVSGAVGITTTLYTGGDGRGETKTGDAAGDTYDNIQNLLGSDFNDTLQGDDSHGNVLTGGKGDDTLEGMAGNDTLVGGYGGEADTGSDTASYLHATSTDVVNNTGIQASLQDEVLRTYANTGDAGGDIYVGIENLLGSQFNDILEGRNDVSNRLDGNAGNDLLIGGTGTVGDQLVGGTDGQTGFGSSLVGGDTASYETSSSALVASLSSAANLRAGGPVVSLSGDAQNDTYSGIENLTGGSGNDLLIGSSASDDTDHNLGLNILTGGVGNDTLEGMGGADNLVGGDGSDTASYAHAAATDGVTQGTVAILSSLPDSYSGNTTWRSLTATGDANGDYYSSIENLLGSDYNDTLIGAIGQANTLSGGLGDDLLEGRGGTGTDGDSYEGGLGTDTVSFNHATARVQASLTESFTVGSFTQSGDAAYAHYSGIENLEGSFYNDYLIGNALDNTIQGGSDNDTLEGMAGSDSLVGGDGDHDVASYAHADTYVYASLLPSGTATGADSRLTGFITQGMAAGDRFDSIEVMEGSNFNDFLVANDANNTLYGAGGNDTLEGLGGADLFDGGTGTNTVSYEHSAKIADHTGVTAWLQSATASTTVWGTPVTPLNDDATGDSYYYINNLTGSAFDDVLYGSDARTYYYSATPITDTGANILIGGGGNDTIYGGSSKIIVSGTGADTIYGGDGNDQIFSNGAGTNHSIFGDAGNDIIVFTSADGGQDYISGGSGSDTFVWDNTTTANSSRIEVNLNAGTVYYSSSCPVNGTYTYLTSIENIQLVNSSATLVNGGDNQTNAGNDYMYIYPDTNDNIITGGISGNPDYLDYRYANAGVRVVLGETDFGGVLKTDTVGHSYGAGADTTSGVTGTDTLWHMDYIQAGTPYDDVLIGNSNDQTIRGGSGGSDYIDGGAGNDTWQIDWNGGAVTASLLTAAQNKTLGIVMTGDAAGDTVVNMEGLYAYYSNSLSAGSTVYGDAGRNWLYGNAYIEGFYGSDYIYGWSTTATASYAHSGSPTIFAMSTNGTSLTAASGLGVTATLQTFLAGSSGQISNHGDAFGDSYNNVVRNLYGSDYSDWLGGDSNANTLTGGAGDDVLEGRGGSDSFYGGSGNDWVSYQNSAGAVTASLEDTDQNNQLGIVLSGDAAGDIFNSIENLIGSDGDDKLYGHLSLDNIFIGGKGNDTIDGLAGNNTVSFGAVYAGINADATGLDTVIQATNVAVTVDLTNHTATSSATGTDTLNHINRVIGGTNNDTIYGSTADETFDGGGGTDYIDGGVNDLPNNHADGGIDTVSFDSRSSSGVTFNLASPTDGGYFSALYDIENIIGSRFADSLTGDANNNTIEGGFGDDTLDGAGGTNTVSYAMATGAVTVSLTDGAASGAEGADTLSNFTHIIGSSYNDSLTGDTNANNLSGGSGNDTLYGGGGLSSGIPTDTFSGGSGTDTVDFSVAAYSSGVTANLTTDTTHFSSIEVLIGGSGNDSLVGSTSDNTISGGAGNDTLTGGGGTTDTDTVDYSYAAYGLSIDLSSAAQQIGNGTTDRDTLTDTFHNIIGGSGDDTLIGGSGFNNIMEGGAGNDILTANSSDADTASYAHAGEAVSVSLLLQGSAQNTGSAGNDTLSNFKNLLGSDYNDTLTGNGSNNLLTGGAGNDTLDGYTGNDTLDGGIGNDTASYTHFDATHQFKVNASLTNGTGTLYDAVTGATLNNTHVYSGIENLTGGDYNDTLYGSAGDNILIGGSGNDYFAGYDGNDSIYANAGDTVYAGNHDDTVYIDASTLGTVASLPSYLNGEGNNAVQYNGGDTLKLTGMVAGTTYNLNNLANVSYNFENIDIREGVGGSSPVASTIQMSFADIAHIANGTSAVGGSGASMYQIWVKADSGDHFSFVDTNGYRAVANYGGELSGPDSSTVDSNFAINGTIDYVIYNSSNSPVATVHWQTSA